ncbi:aminopeptidase N [Streptomyces sp. NPDC051567]|uniref:aminopeptidase N n=1 Tax=Streptomyces sp. NPDC051567 TaxID=3365660 RepID=UPI00379AD95A
MSELTRTEAQLRAQLIDVQHYAVALDLTVGDDTFDSTTVVRFRAHAAGDTFVELKPDALRSATLDGHPLDPASLTDGRLPLTGLAEGPHELRVDARMTYSRTGEGLHRFTDPADGETYVYTQLFMTDVQRVFAAFDQPDLKAVFEFTVTAPAHWTVLANGVTTRTGDRDASHGTDAADAAHGADRTDTSDAAGGAGIWTSAPTPVISTYLAAVAAGNWHSIRTTHAGLPFGIHCRKSLAPHLDADADEILSITTACYDRYHEKFSEPYPFDSYDQAFVPEFNAGAMENPGLITFRDEFVFRSAVTDAERQRRAMVIAHEMAHMWFGDLVTLRWWDDIWLNESFAEYMGYQTLTEATRFTDTWTQFAMERKPWGYEADQRPSTHPVAPEAVPDTASALLNFDGISYAKGASALRQLVTWLGEKDFLAGINTHFTRHRFANASLADFVDSLAAHTPRPVHTWADAWLRTTGPDTLTPRIEEDPDGWTLTVDRRGSRPHRITAGAYDRTPSGALAPREPLHLDVPSDEVVSVSGTRPDLLLLNDGDLTYTKVRLDDTSLDTALRDLSRIPGPLTRAVLWAALRDMVRDGELDPRDYLATAEAHLPQEDDLAVVQGVLSFARHQITDHYLTGDDRTAALATLTSIAHRLLDRTGTPADADAPDSGMRLAAVRALVDSATAPDTLAAWLADDTVPGGPALDPDLRWRILARLAVLGAATGTDIAAALAADPSATGEEGAARCHAALPSAQAKAAAWQRMFHDDTLSNYLFTATAQGFWQPEQADLVREYVPRFYPEAIALSARRGPAIGEAAGRWAFPAHAVDEANLQTGLAHLDDPAMIPLLHRRLVDQLDDLARALRVRSA